MLDIAKSAEEHTMGRHMRVLQNTFANNEQDCAIHLGHRVFGPVKHSF